MDWIRGLFNPQQLVKGTLEERMGRAYKNIDEAAQQEGEVWEVNINKLKIPVGNANNVGPQNLSWANYERRKKGGRRKTRKVRKSRKARKAQRKSSTRK